MNSPKKSLFLNPVLSAPWKTQTKNYENPCNFLCPMESQPKIRKRNRNSKSRIQNMESLILRFPGLRKYEARAALTMSGNKLEKAIILLEVSQFYRKEIVEKNLNTAYLKNIRIGLCYDSNEQDPTLRNVILEASADFNKEDSALISRRYDKENTTREINNANNPSYDKNKKIGVVITKTMQGYKATTFEERF